MRSLLRTLEQSVTSLHLRDIDRKPTFRDLTIVDKMMTLKIYDFLDTLQLVMDNELSA